MSIAWALLIIRVMVGLTLVAHGAQKAFGWFGGAGYAKIAQGFKTQGFKPAELWVGLGILGELGGGLSLTLGFLTALGAAGALGAMVMATQTQWKNGFFSSKGGYEYPLVLGVMSAALGISGAGAISFDHLFGISWPIVFIVLAIVAILVDVVGISMRRSAA